MTPVKRAVPGPGRKIERKTDLLFGWRARDLVLDPLTGQSPSFSRASSAGGVKTRTGDGKTLLSDPVAQDVPRWGMVKDENGLWVPAVRLEAARTNSILRSEEFDHGDWNGAATITADDAVAPDGATTSDKVEDTDDTGADAIRQAFTVADDSLDRDASFFVRKVSSFSVTAELNMRYSGGTTAVSYGVQINPATGATDTSVATAPTRASVEDYNSDWWRLWMVAPNNGTGNTTLRVRLYPARNASGADGSTDDSATGAQHVWGAQVEGISGGAAFPSSYIATTDSAVSRAADDLSFPISFGPQELTVYEKFHASGFPLGPTKRLWSIGSGDRAEQPRLNLFGNKGSVSAEWVDGSGTAVRPGSPDNVVSYGDVVETRIVLQSDGTVVIGWSVNGGSESTASGSGGAPSSSSWPTSKVRIGRFAGGANPGVSFADHISGPIIAPGVRTMDEMRRYN